MTSVYDRVVGLRQSGETYANTGQGFVDRALDDTDNPGSALLVRGFNEVRDAVEEMTKNSSLPGSFFHFIGVMEVLGGIGLVLPSLRRISPFLTRSRPVGL